MFIKNLKITKCLASFLVVTTFTCFILNDYTYAQTPAKILPSISELRKARGYDKTFTNIGFREEIAINQSADLYAKKMNTNYANQQTKIENNLKAKKESAWATAEKKTNEIKQTATLNREQLNVNYAKNLADYKSTYSVQKAKLASDFDIKVAQVDKNLARLRDVSAIAAKKIDTQSGINKIGSVVASGIMKPVQGIMSGLTSVVGFFSGKDNNPLTKINDKIQNIDKDLADLKNSKNDNMASIQKNTADQIKNLEKKKKDLLEAKSASLTNMDKRNDETLANMELSFKNEIEAVNNRENSYIASLVNSTTDELAKLDGEIKSRLEDLYTLTNSELENYLFGDDGLFKKAYEYDDKTALRNLKSDQDNSNREIQTDEKSGGYIGNLANYMGVEEQKRAFASNQYLEKAEKLLLSGASDGTRRAGEFAAAAGVVSKDAQVLMPRDFSDASLARSGAIELNMDQGEAAGTVRDNKVANIDASFLKSQQELADYSDSIVKYSDEVTGFLEDTINNFADNSKNEMNDFTNKTVKKNDEINQKEIQALLAFVKELQQYMDMVWPESQSAGYERATEALKEAAELYLNASIDTLAIILAVVLGIVGGLVATIIGAIFLITTGIPMIFSGILTPCGIVQVVAAVASLIIGITGVALGIWGIISAISEREQLKTALEIASNNVKVLNDLLPDPSKKDWPENTPSEYKVFMDAEKNYNSAMGQFKVMFFRRFGIEGLKKVRNKINQINRLLGKKGISGLTHDELLKLQELLFFFKPASNDKLLKRSMEGLKNTFKSYQEALENFKKSTKTVTYTLKELKDGSIVETTYTKTIWEAYQDKQFWGVVASELDMALNNAYVFDIDANGNVIKVDRSDGSTYTEEYKDPETGEWKTVTKKGWSGFANKASQSGDRFFSAINNGFTKFIDATDAFFSGVISGVIYGVTFGHVKVDKFPTWVKGITTFIPNFFKAIVDMTFMGYNLTLHLAKGLSQNGVLKGLQDFALGMASFPLGIIENAIGMKQGTFLDLFKGKTHSAKEIWGEGEYWNPGAAAGTLGFTIVMMMGSPSGASSIKAFVSNIKSALSSIWNAIKYVAVNGIWAGLKASFKVVGSALGKIINWTKSQFNFKTVLGNGFKAGVSAVLHNVLSGVKIGLGGLGIAAVAVLGAAGSIAGSIVFGLGKSLLTATKALATTASKYLKKFYKESSIKSLFKWASKQVTPRKSAGALLAAILLTPVLIVSHVLGITQAIKQLHTGFVGLRKEYKAMQKVYNSTGSYVQTRNGMPVNLRTQFIQNTISYGLQVPQVLINTVMSVALAPLLITSPLLFIGVKIGHVFWSEVILGQRKLRAMQKEQQKEQSRGAINSQKTQIESETNAQAVQASARNLRDHAKAFGIEVFDKTGKSLGVVSYKVFMEKMISGEISSFAVNQGGSKNAISLGIGAREALTRDYLASRDNASLTRLLARNNGNNKLEALVAAERVQRSTIILREYNAQRQKLTGQSAINFLEQMLNQNKLRSKVATSAQKAFLKMQNAAIKTELANLHAQALAARIEFLFSQSKLDPKIVELLDSNLGILDFSKIKAGGLTRNAAETLVRQMGDILGVVSKKYQESCSTGNKQIIKDSSSVVSARFKEIVNSEKFQEILKIASLAERQQKIMDYMKELKAVESATPPTALERLVIDRMTQVLRDNPSITPKQLAKMEVQLQKETVLALETGALVYNGFTSYNNIADGIKQLGVRPDLELNNQRKAVKATTALNEIEITAHHQTVVSQLNEIIAMKPELFSKNQGPAEGRIEARRKANSDFIASVREKYKNDPIGKILAKRLEFLLEINVYNNQGISAKDMKNFTSLLKEEVTFALKSGDIVPANGRFISQTQMEAYLKTFASEAELMRHAQETFKVQKQKEALDKKYEGKQFEKYSRSKRNAAQDLVKECLVIGNMGEKERQTAIEALQKQISDIKIERDTESPSMRKLLNRQVDALEMLVSSIKNNDVARIKEAVTAYFSKGGASSSVTAEAFVASIKSVITVTEAFAERVDQLSRISKDHEIHKADGKLSMQDFQKREVGAETKATLVILKAQLDALKDTSTRPISLETYKEYAALREKIEKSDAYKNATTEQRTAATTATTPHEILAAALNPLEAVTYNKLMEQFKGLDLKSEQSFRDSFNQAIREKINLFVAEAGSSMPVATIVDYLRGNRSRIPTDLMASLEQQIVNKLKGREAVTANDLTRDQALLGTLPQSSIREVLAARPDLHRLILQKEISYLQAKETVPAAVQEANRQVNETLSLTDAAALVKLKETIATISDPTLKKQITALIKGKELGKITFARLSELIEQTKSSPEATQALNLIVSRRMNQLQTYKNAAGSAQKSASNALIAEYKKLEDYIMKGVEKASAGYLEILNREHLPLMEKMYKIMEAAGIPKAEISTFDLSTGKIGDKTFYQKVQELASAKKLTSAEYIQRELFGENHQLTHLQADALRVVGLKLIEGHNKIGDGTITARTAALTDPNFNFTQKQILMMAANDQGMIAALGMGGGKTRVYPTVIGSMMQKGIGGGIGEILVSSKQEIANMLGNKDYMETFYGVKMLDGTKLHAENKLGETLASHKRDGIKVIVVFDLETRGHLSHEIRTNKSLQILDKIDILAIDEADALSLKQQSFINAERLPATDLIKNQVAKILETYEKLKGEGAEKFDAKKGGFADKTFLDAMLAELKTNAEFQKDQSSYLKKSLFSLSDKEWTGQTSAMITQVLRGRAEVLSGETKGGFKVDTVGGIQVGVQDGNNYNSVAVQIIDAFQKNAPQGVTFSIERFKTTTGASVSEFAATVSKTTVESAAQEILTRAPGVRLHVFGGSGTTGGAKRISEAVTAPVAEISEASFANYAFNTQVQKPGQRTTDVVAAFAGKALEGKWGRLIIQSQENLAENLLATIEKVAGPEAAAAFKNAASTSGKVERISDVQFAIEKLDSAFVDPVFIKGQGGGFISLNQAITDGLVRSNGKKFFETVSGREVKVSLGDILASPTAMRELNIPENHRATLQKIIVIDHYTNPESVSGLAKNTSANGNIVFSTAKAGRGMDFRGKMQLLVTDVDSLAKNDFLQISGRVGRGESRDVFHRTVLVNPTQLKSTFTEQIEILQQKKEFMQSSTLGKEFIEQGGGLKAPPADRQITQSEQAFRAEWTELQSNLKSLKIYEKQLDKGSFTQASSAEMIRASTIIQGEFKSNGAALYQIGEGVRSAILKIPLERMKAKAEAMGNTHDAALIQRIIDEMIRTNKGATADALILQESGWKNPKEVFEKMMKANYEAAIQIYKMLDAVRITDPKSMMEKVASPITRKVAIGEFNVGLQDPTLLREVRTRVLDLEQGKMEVQAIGKRDWYETRAKATEKAKSGQLTTLSEINSMDNPQISRQVLETVTYVAKDLNPQRKTTASDSYAPKQTVRIANQALTGVKGTEAVRVNTSNAGQLVSSLEHYKTKGDRIGAIVLTNRQLIALQQDPIAYKRFQAEIVATTDWKHGVFATGQAKILIADSDQDITNGRAKTLEQALGQAQALKPPIVTNATQIVLGSSSQDKKKDKDLQKLFEIQTRDLRAGIDPKLWDDLDTNLEIAIDKQRFDAMPEKARQEFIAQLGREAQLRSERARDAGKDTGQVTAVLREEVVDTSLKGNQIATSVLSKLSTQPTVRSEALALLIEAQESEIARLEKEKGAASDLESLGLEALFNEEALVTKKDLEAKIQDLKVERQKLLALETEVRIFETMDKIIDTKTNKQEALALTKKAQTLLPQLAAQMDRLNDEAQALQTQVQVIGQELLDQGNLAVLANIVRGDQAPQIIQQYTTLRDDKNEALKDKLLAIARTAAPTEQSKVMTHSTLLMTTDATVNAGYAKIEEQYRKDVFPGVYQPTVNADANATTSPQQPVVVQNARLDLAQPAILKDAKAKLKNEAEGNKSTSSQGPSTAAKTQYTSLVTMEVRDKLLTETGVSQLEIVISTEVQDAAEKALRDGVQKANEETRRYVTSSPRQSLPKSLVVKNSKGKIVDIYELRNGQLESRNAGIQSRLTRGKEDTSDQMQQLMAMFAQQGMAPPAGLGANGGVGEIKIKSFTFGKKSKQLEQLMSELSKQKKDGSVTIDLSEVADENVEEFVKSVYSAIFEDQNLPRNVVFKKGSKYFGATDADLRNYLETWSGAERTLALADSASLSFSKQNPDVLLREDTLKPNLTDSYFAEKPFRQEADQVALAKTYEGREYFDGKIEIEGDNGPTTKALFKKDVTANKVIITIDPENLRYFGAEYNALEKFIKGLRQIELEFKDLGKDLEIVIPTTTDSSLTETRANLVTALKTFVDEYKTDAREFRLLNSAGNLLFTNKPDNYEKTTSLSVGKNVLAVPETVFSTDAAFKAWLQNALKTDEMRALDEKGEGVTLGLGSVEKLTDETIQMITEVIARSFPGENVTLVNKLGQVIIDPASHHAVTSIAAQSLRITNVRLNKQILNMLDQNNIANFTKIEISEELANSPSDILLLTNFLTQKGFSGDVVVKTNSGEVKIWREALFEAGAIVKDVGSLEDLNKFLATLDEQAASVDYTNYSIVLNLKFRDKFTDWSKLNALIKSGKLKDLTITQRGQILATNNAKVQQFVKHYEIISRSHDIKLETLRSYQGELQPVNASALQKIDFGKIGGASTTVQPNFSLPVIAGSVVASFQGADASFAKYVTYMGKSDVTQTANFAAEFKKSVRSLGVEAGLIRRTSDAFPRTTDTANMRHLDSAA